MEVLPCHSYLMMPTYSSCRMHHSSLPEEYQEWVSEVIRTRPDLVKGETYTGRLSAYIPEMAPDNFSRHEEGVYLQGYNDGIPYRCAVLEVTLAQVGTIPYEDSGTYYEVDKDGNPGEKGQIRYSLSGFCVGTIDRAIGLEQGFAPPEGKTIMLKVTVCDEDALEALQLEEGGHYLVYGMDYSDVQGIEKRNLFSPSFRESFEELFGKGLREEEFTAKMDCFMTVCDYSALPSSAPDPEGNGFKVYQDKRREYDRLPDLEGRVVGELVPAETYIPDYCVPTMAKLEGGAEDYLASEEGFPVLAVEKLGHQAVFVREQARIVEGRDFTERERSGGSRVCILSQSLAEANSLEVGDTIDLRYYGYDYNIKVQQENMENTSVPGAAVYSRRAGFLTETEGYRIVGLYRQSDAWQNSQDPYGFTPNTIFVPKSSVSCEMLLGESGVYYSLLLQNGKKGEFEQLGIAAAGAVLALFLILFPLQQGRTAGLMNSLGARRRERVWQIVGSAACILVPGAVLGGICGGLAWKRVTARLMESVRVEIPLEAHTLFMAAAMAAVFVALALAASLAAALALTREKGLKKRK